MKPLDRKLNASVPVTEKKWINSIFWPRASSTLGYFFVSLFILFWSSSLINQTGFSLKNIWGILVLLGFILIFALITLLIASVLSILGLDRPTRSALFFSAVIGPYVDLLVEHAWKISVISHILGFLAAILAFLSSFLLDKLLAKSLRKLGDG
jgi:hypothetical protein